MFSPQTLETGCHEAERALEPRTPYVGGDIPGPWPPGAPYAVGTTEARKVAGPALWAGTVCWAGPTWRWAGNEQHVDKEGSARAGTASSCQASQV